MTAFDVFAILVAIITVLGGLGVLGAFLYRFILHGRIRILPQLNDGVAQYIVQEYNGPLNKWYAYGYQNYRFDTMEGAEARLEEIRGEKLAEKAREAIEKQWYKDNKPKVMR